MYVRSVSVLIAAKNYFGSRFLSASFFVINCIALLVALVAQKGGGLFFLFLVLFLFNCFGLLASIIYQLGTGRWLALLSNLSILALFACSGLIWGPAYHEVIATNNLKGQFGLLGLKRRCANEVNLYCGQRQFTWDILRACLKENAQRLTPQCAQGLDEEVLQEPIPAPKLIGGVEFPAGTKLEFVGGKVIYADLSQPILVQRIRCQKGGIWFRVSGGLQTCNLDGDQVVDGILLKGGQNGLFSLWEDGHLESGVPVDDVVIDGIKWAASKQINFFPHSNGKVSLGTLAEDAIIKGAQRKKGELVSPY